MYAFEKKIRKADRVRRYTIESTPAGWEVRKEQDNQVVRRTRLNDWHRVEQARRSFVFELEALQLRGWSED